MDRFAGFFDRRDLFLVPLRGRQRPWMCVFDTGAIGQKSASANSGILVCCVGKEGSRSNTGIELAFLIALERKQADCRVVCADGET